MMPLTKPYKAFSHDSRQVAAPTALHYSGSEVTFESTSSVALERLSCFADAIGFGFISHALK
jgi:hypothetical protein